MSHQQSESNIATYIILYVIFFALHLIFAIGMNTSGFYFSDMAGYIGNARVLLYGYGLPALHSHVYYPGYSFLLMPALLIAKNDFSLAYRFVQLMNSVLLSFIPIFVYQLSEIFRPALEKKMKILISIAISCYPAYIVYSNLIMSEAILLPLFLLLTVMVYKLSQNSDKYIYWISVPLCYGYLYLCTPRALTILPALILALFLVACKNKQYKKFAFSVLFFIFGFFITATSVDKMNFFLAQSFFSPTETGNTYNVNNFKEFLNLPRLDFISILSSQFLYLILSTYGFILIGLTFLFDKIKLKYWHTDKNYILNTFVLLSFISTWIISSVYFSIYHATKDELIYGRYNEMIMIPVLILGIISFLNNYLKTKTKILIAFLTLSVFLLTYVRFGSDLTGPVMFTANILGIQLCRIVAPELNLIYCALAFLFATLIIFTSALKNKFTSLILLTVIFLATSIVSNKELETIAFWDKTQNEIMNALEIYINQHNQVIINFDIPQKYFVYQDTPIPKRDPSQNAYNNYICIFLPIMNQYYKYQLYFPHTKVKCIDSRSGEKPASDLIISTHRDLNKIYPGARIIGEKGEEVKLWQLPSKAK